MNLDSITKILDAATPPPLPVSIPPNRLIKSAGALYKQATIYEREGNEKLALIFFLKFASIFFDFLAKKSEDDSGGLSAGHLHVLNEMAERAVGRAEQLRASLEASFAAAAAKAAAQAQAQRDREAAEAQARAEAQRAREAAAAAAKAADDAAAQVVATRGASSALLDDDERSRFSALRSLVAAPPSIAGDFTHPNASRHPPSPPPSPPPDRRPVVDEELPRSAPVYDELPPARGEPVHLPHPPAATSEAAEQLERGRQAMAEAEAARARAAQRAREAEMVRREMAWAEETARQAREAEVAARAAEAHHQRLAEEAEARRRAEAAAIAAAARQTAAEAVLSSPSSPVDLASTSSDPYAAFTKTPDGRELRRVIISPDLPAKFQQIAAANTRRKIETCGVLAGRLHRGTFTVTTLIIPSQTGTSDTCNTLDEDRLFTYQDANDVITLGWIHTHPTQDCFLSSVDLHTQFAYQVMMDEAIAIVVAPTAAERLGTFSLSKRGLQVLRECPRSGFHPHPEGGLYSEASHVVWSRVPFNVADLRR